MQEPFPCMPVYFWNDKGNEKYKAAYFSRFTNVWYHGDYISINTKTNGVKMLGRRYVLRTLYFIF